MTKKNIFNEIIKKGHDLDFVAEKNACPTNARPGSLEKIAILRQRLENGLDLWHPTDEHYYVVEEARLPQTGLIGEERRILKRIGMT